MTKTVAEKLSDLVEAVRTLPDQTQEALVAEFVDRLADFTDAALSDEQRAEVDRRLAIRATPIPTRSGNSSRASASRTDDRRLSR